MKSPILVKRYTQGLADALKDEPEFIAISRELTEFLELLSAHSLLKETLASPFVAARKKTQVIREVLVRSSFTDKPSRFILLLLEHKRLELLEDILRELPVLWNERRGVTTFEVRSAVTLAKSQKQRLQEELERLEGRPVFLRYSIDPALVAGFALQKGNVIYDASLRGHLAKIQQRMTEG